MYSIYNNKSHVDTMPTDTQLTCQEAMSRFDFLECDDDNPDRYEEEQCTSDQACYCVDPVTGDRLSDRTYTRAEIDCDGNIYSNNFRYNG